METEAAVALEQFGATSGLQSLISDWGWIAAVAFLLLLFKQSIEQGVAGALVFFGGDYREDDVVIVDGRLGTNYASGTNQNSVLLYTPRGCISRRD